MCVLCLTCTQCTCDCECGERQNLITGDRVQSQAVKPEVDDHDQLDPPGKGFGAELGKVAKVNLASAKRLY